MKTYHLANWGLQILVSILLLSLVYSNAITPPYTFIVIILEFVLVMISNNRSDEQA